MRKTILALILAVLAVPVWAATAYPRPTADAGTGTPTFGCDIGTYDTGVLGGSFYVSYSGKAGIGPTGTSASGQVSYADNGARSYGNDVFGYNGSSYGLWQSPPSGTLSSATLNISIQSTSSGTGTPTYCAAYTINSGSTWTTMGTVTSSQSTLTVSGITTISGLGLLIGCNTSANSNSICELTVYDVWITWNYTPGSSQPAHVWLLSELDEKIWRWHDARREHLAQSPPY